MTVDEILGYFPRVLSQAQRQFYFERGYLFLEGLISNEWVTRLEELAQCFVEQSREAQETNDVFTLGPGHSPDRPFLRCLKLPDDRHPDFWSYATGIIADVASDLVGPDVAFSHAKLNYKWEQGDDQWRWHQDIQYFPHTNYSPLTIGTYLRDTSFKDGALGVIPGSHNGPLYDLYDNAGNWTGHLTDTDVSTLPLDTVTYLEGPAGSVTVHNCRTVHWSPPSRQGRGRPFLANIYAASDAFPYCMHPSQSSHRGAIVRGKPARWAHHDPRPCLVPGWS